INALLSSSDIDERRDGASRGARPVHRGAASLRGLEDDLVQGGHQRSLRAISRTAVRSAWSFSFTSASARSRAAFASASAVSDSALVRSALRSAATADSNAEYAAR